VKGAKGEAGKGGRERGAEKGGQGKGGRAGGGGGWFSCLLAVDEELKSLGEPRLRTVPLGEGRHDLGVVCDEARVHALLLQKVAQPAATPRASGVRNRAQQVRDKAHFTRNSKGPHHIVQGTVLYPMGTVPRIQVGQSTLSSSLAVVWGSSAAAGARRRP